jgi:hypothetical protein
MREMRGEEGKTKNEDPERTVWGGAGHIGMEVWGRKHNRCLRFGLEVCRLRRLTVGKSAISSCPMESTVSLADYCAHHAWTVVLRADQTIVS